MAARGDQAKWMHAFSAPATLERQKSRNNWLSSAKAAFMKPWRLRSQRRAKRRGAPVKSPSRQIPPSSTSLTSFEGNSPYQPSPFPNFGRLSPLGGRPQSAEKKEMPESYDYVDGPAKKEDDFELKIPDQSSSRPPLSNLFPMFNSPETAKAKTPEVKVQETLQMPAGNRQEQRRHSTPIAIQVTTPPPGGRRQSASSDTSMDKSRMERRERRASATRDLPLLPRRGEDPLQTSRPGSAHSKPPSRTSPASSLAVSPYSEFSGLLGRDFDQPDSADQLSPSHRPPVAPGGNFSPPPWMQPYQQLPHQQLQELEEELEEDGEGDGEEEGATRVDEEYEGACKEQKFQPEDYEKGWGEQTFPPVPPAAPLKNPQAPPAPAMPSKGKEGGRFGKLLNIVSSKNTKAADVKEEKKAGKVKGQGDKKEEEDREIRGFDDFFMY